MEQQNSRLQSIDALRGFDMFWIMGGPWIITSLYGIFGGKSFEWLNNQMEHVPWDGFHFMDLIFPLFLFIAGLSFPFSLDKKREKNESEKQIFLHLLKRAITLIVLGFIYNGFLKFDFPTTRYASVLSHIGLGWFFGALIFMYSKKISTKLIWVISIILGYAALNLFVLSPEATGTNPFLIENNIVTQFDRWFLPGVLYGHTFDPEGILSVIPAIATALIGMLAGRFLKQKDKYQPVQKTLIFLFSGLAFIILSLIVNLVVPINKALWSSSFVLLTGGISLILLSIFYWIIDIKHYTKWAFFFRVIGMNSITIYMAQQIFNFYGVGQFFLGGIASKFPPVYGSMILGIAYIAVCWLFLWFLYRMKIFIKV